MFGLEAEQSPALKNIVASENVSFPLAFAVDFDFATATDRGMVEMNDTYNYLKKIAGERGIENLWDLLDIEEELPQRTMTITI